jgi:2,4-dienoyl-CoA reductase-like NADH-dependent reductase (Old Yellow Enzyme family)/thioredoxin reductase
MPSDAAPPVVFRRLFTPLRVGPVTVANRVLSTGHMTTFVADYLPTDRLVAYHEARARGGTGLIVLEAASVHPTGVLTPFTLDAATDAIVPGWRRIGEAVHRYETKVFAQLFHAGREGAGPAGTWAPSVVPSGRYHRMPRALTVETIREIVAGYGAAARRAREAGLDGVEIVASHGYLPAQFWSPHTNRRTDAYGGSFERRLRFVVEVVAAIRAAVGRDHTVGLRLSGDERAPDGMTLEETLDVTRHLGAHAALDYLNVTSGESSTHTGATHIVPPGGWYDAAYNAPLAAAVKPTFPGPVFVGSRVQDPVVAEEVLARGQADMVGMTRALIADPDMPRKTRDGRYHAVRFCIGCNQGCIGHMQANLPITCIQTPATGRERELYDVGRAAAPRRVVVVGAGPAGMQAAVIAARRGHAVTLLEREREPGGTVRTIRRVPNRGDWGRLIDNLVAELTAHGVELRLATVATADTVLALAPDLAVLATGAEPYRPPLPGCDGPGVLPAGAAIDGAAPIGRRVVVVDWDGGAPGVSAAAALAARGAEVTLASAMLGIGEGLQSYLRTLYLGYLERHGVATRTGLRLAAVDGPAVVFRSVVSGAEVRLGPADTVVLATGFVPRTALEETLAGRLQTASVGDCRIPRTAEEAILEATEAALRV